MPSDSMNNLETFPFLRLPLELRLRILEFTDLVAPLNRITWHQRAGYKISWNFSICMPSCKPPYDTCHPKAHQACAPDHYAWGSSTCTICPHARPRHRRDPKIYSNCWTCRHYACQFQSTWKPPSSLFLVCRTLLDEAQRIFFSHNHFEIHDDHDWRVYGNDLSETPVPKPTRWAISEFLSRRLKSNSLHYVRSLQYWFLCSVTSLTEPNGERTVDDEIFAEHVSMYQDWLQVLGNVKERLKLRLFIWDCFRLEGDLKMDTCRKMQPEQCFTLVEPLRDKIFGRPMSIEVQELVLDTEESQVELRLQYIPKTTTPNIWAMHDSLGLG
ncbi:hypothetical protein BKA67DRAFT_329604 [Truncatella angustata]|uniref:Uncharacterized protein n=1 Tax=Truncatella angustata TaxID=152316 RepID=A0A9P8UFT4_9PEZI|nr:uncharacterized protein BKA67DRAFT_329604 [Truncatella angustata]KAH6651457.1 hypothetical protein BKA67DRAFT_329604 [Truncatella angustata]